MQQTITEKVISSHCSKRARAGDFVLVNVDFIFASDTTAPLAIQAFREMGGVTINSASRMAMIIDHATPSPNQKIANLHKTIREFALEQNIILYDMGDGICHQLLVEKGHFKEGNLVVGADSHTCTYGGIGVFSTGVGSTDLAAIMLTGKTWVQVPYTILINLSGELQQGVYAKDVALYIIGILKADGATYMALEFGGTSIKFMSVDDRLTICNMAVEMGAKTGIFPGNWLVSDDNAIYKEIIDIDLSIIEPQIALPHSVDNVVPVSNVEGMEIQQIFIGSCTNGRYSDLEVVAKILKQKKIYPGVRMIINPASREVVKQAIKSGAIEVLIEAGATLLSPGCGLCVGTLGGIPGDGDKVLSTSNRNFKGRMGNNAAKIFLVSPATAAYSALTGRITSPKKEGVE